LLQIIEKPVILRGVWPIFAPHILLPPLRVFSSRLRSFAALYLRLAALGHNLSKSSGLAGTGRHEWHSKRLGAVPDGATRSRETGES
jgi:hypothetical protein